MAENLIVIRSGNYDPENLGPISETEWQTYVAEDIRGFFGAPDFDLHGLRFQDGRLELFVQTQEQIEELVDIAKDLGASVLDPEGFLYMRMYDSDTNSWPVVIFRVTQTPLSSVPQIKKQLTYNWGWTSPVWIVPVFLITQLSIDGLLGDGYYKNHLWTHHLAAVLVAATYIVVGWKHNRQDPPPLAEYHFLMIPLEYLSIPWLAMWGMMVYLSN